MSTYDAYLERLGQPDSDEDSDALIADGAEAARNLRRLLDYQEPNLEEYDDMEAA